MKANRNCRWSPVLLILLNGKNMVQEGCCLGANEETGEVLMIYRDASGRAVPKHRAEIGALIVDDLQVIVLKGEVKISIDPKYQTSFGMTEQELLDDMVKTYSPIEVQRKVRDDIGCGAPRCDAEHTRLEFAFNF